MNEERKVVEYKIEKVANLIEVKFPNGICSFSHKRGLLEFFQQRVELGDEPGELRLVVQNIFLFLLNQVDIKRLLFHWQFTKCSFQLSICWRGVSQSHGIWKCWIWFLLHSVCVQILFCSVQMYTPIWNRVKFFPDLWFLPIGFKFSKDKVRLWFATKQFSPFWSSCKKGKQYHVV